MENLVPCRTHVDDIMYTYVSIPPNTAYPDDSITGVDTTADPDVVKYVHFATPAVVPTFMYTWLSPTNQLPEVSSATVPAIAYDRDRVHDWVPVDVTLYMAEPAVPTYRLPVVSSVGEPPMAPEAVNVHCSVPVVALIAYR